MSLSILLIYAGWIGAIFYVHRLCKRSHPGSVGIPLAYLVTMTFLHCGGLLYAIPGYTHLRVGAHWYLQALSFTEQMVFDGVVATAISVAGITLGCYLVTDRKRLAAGATATRPASNPRPLRPPPPLSPYTRVPLFLIFGGFLAFGLTSLNLNLPSIQSIIMAGRNLAVVAVSLGLWLAWQRRNEFGLRFWTAMTLFVPAAYLIGWGFLSYGFTAMAIFFGFWLSTPRPGKEKALLRAAIIVFGIYACLSAFVGYIEVRASLRDVLWNSDAGFGERISVIAAKFSGIRPLNPLNFTQLDWINMRLNQNMLIGKAMALHEVFPDLRENGLGLLQSLFAWVPRFLWPTKPIMGGNDFVEKHTNMSFSDTTTIGAGPVFELFVNFGLIGVFVGSVILGWALRWMDAYCARQLQRRDVPRFIRGYLVAVSLINPMSLIFFFVSAAVASWILGTGIKMAIDMTRKNQRLRLRPPPRPPGPPQRPQPEEQIWAS